MNGLIPYSNLGGEKVWRIATIHQVFHQYHNEACDHKILYRRTYAGARYINFCVKQIEVH